MGPKLKENPRDWWKFTAGLCVAGALVALLSHRRGAISGQRMWLLFGGLLLLLFVALLQPRLVRPIYWVGMTVAFYVGQVVGKVLLTIFFLLVLTPLGVILRLLGKDLLKLKQTPDAPSYWQPVKRKPDLRQQF